MTPPALRTARLRLRPLTPLDAKAMRAALDDLEISKWLRPVPFPYTLDDAVAFIGHAADGEELIWVLDDGGFAGIAGLDTEYGYWLARDRWGRGYATEASRAILQWHFSAGPGHEVTSGHFEGNARSAGVLRKLGFVYEGTAMHQCLARGEAVLSHRMRLTRPAWEAAARAAA